MDGVPVVLTCPSLVGSKSRPHWPRADRTLLPRAWQRTLGWACLLGLHLAAPAPVPAQLPSAKLSLVFPPGAAAGSTTEVSVRGADLDGPRGLLFSDPRISGHLMEASSNSPASGPHRFQVAVSSNVPPGRYDVRVAGRFGVSNPRAFSVSPWPERSLVATNLTFTNAVELALPCVVSSWSTNDARQYFRFSVPQGHSLRLHCQGQEIDSRLSPALVLFDEHGEEIANARRGGHLEYTPPCAGTYTLAIHDSLFRGGEDYFYRLWLQSVSIRESAAVGEAGVPVAPLLPLASFTSPLDPSTSSESRSTDDPATPEVESNNTPAQAQSVTVPCELAGRFWPAGDRDWFTFQARAGETFWLEVLSHRLGLPTNPFFVVQQVLTNASGQPETRDLQEVYSADTNPGGPDFNLATRDPTWRFEVKDDGQYRVLLRDLFNQGSGAGSNRVYRFSLRKPAPGFQLLAVPQTPPPLSPDRREGRVWTTFLRRGETVPIRVFLASRDGFSGEVEIGAEGLPSGLSTGRLVLSVHRSSGSLFLSASDSASGWAGPIRIVGRAKLGDTNVVREARAASVIWEVPDYTVEPVRSRLVDQFWVSVTAEETTPLALNLAETKPIQAPAQGKLDIALNLAARAELTGTIKLRATGIPALDSFKEIEVPSATNRAVLTLDLAQQKIPPGTHQIYVWGRAQTKYRRSKAGPSPASEERTFTAYSPLFTLQVTPAP